VVLNRAQKLDQRFDLRLSELVPSFQLVKHFSEEA
jgi:spermidine synthase